MLTLLFVIYYFSKFWVLTYLILSYSVAVFLFLKSSKYYFPNMKHMDNPNFHKDFKGFNRVDGNHVTLGRIFYGVLNYYWIRLVLFAISFIGFYLYYK